RRLWWDARRGGTTCAPGGAVRDVRVRSSRRVRGCDGSREIRQYNILPICGQRRPVRVRAREFGARAGFHDHHEMLAGVPAFPEFIARPVMVGWPYAVGAE